MYQRKGYSGNRRVSCCTIWTLELLQCNTIECLAPLQFTAPPSVQGPTLPLQVHHHQQSILSQPQQTYLHCPYQSPPETLANTQWSMQPRTRRPSLTWIAQGFAAHGQFLLCTHMFMRISVASTWSTGLLPRETALFGASTIFPASHQIWQADEVRSGPIDPDVSKRQKRGLSLVTHSCNHCLIAQFFGNPDQQKA